MRWFYRLMIFFGAFFFTLGLLTLAHAEKANYRVEVKAYDAVHVKNVHIGMALNDGPVHWYDDAESEFSSLDITVIPFSFTFHCALYPSVFVLVDSIGVNDDYDPEFGVTVLMELYKEDVLIKSRQVRIERPNDMSYGLDEGEDHD